MGGISVNGEIAIGWTLCVICLLATAVRYALRYFVIGFLQWDDLAHGIGLLILIAMVALHTGDAARGVLQDVADGSVYNKPQAFYAYLQFNTAFTVLSWICFYSIKIAFLLFYRMLFEIKKWFLYAWWGVLAFVFLSFWATIAGALTWCDGNAAYLLDQNKCTNTGSMQWDPKAYIYTYCLNVSTDLAVMILPLTCIATLQLSKQRKLGLVFLICLGLVIIAFDSVRISQSFGTKTGADNALWAMLEGAVAVLVSCCPTFASIKRWRTDRSRFSSHPGHPLRVRHTNQTTATSQIPLKGLMHPIQGSIGRADSFRGDTWGVDSDL